MSAYLFGITDRYFSFSHVIGRIELAGPGFRMPLDLALGDDDVIYVLNRSAAARTEGIRVTVCTFGEEYISQFGEFGHGDGQFIWPVSIAVGPDQNVYVSDEWLNRVTVFDKDGHFVRHWGHGGSGDGELDKPAGVAVGEDGTVFVVDSRNHRVQKFSPEGDYLAQFGSFGAGQGQLNMPWGIWLGNNNQVSVADWRNDRIQQFTAEGEFQAAFGGSGGGPGQFNRPTGVSVDQDGDIYVADWLNGRVQVLTADGRFVTEFLGDANLSKWGREKLRSNPDMIAQRNLVQDLTPERVFVDPCAVKVDRKGRIAVAEPSRHRIQVYQKHETPVLI